MDRDTWRVRLGAGGDALRRLAPQRATFKNDAVAGLTGAIGSVPDGMAAGVLVGVNPIYGLYASLVAPILGGLFSSTQLLLVTTTNAAAIAAGQTVAGVPEGERAAALFLLVLLIGAVQLAAGLLRLGGLTRFVSHSVMIGFLTGIAMLIILGQLGDFTGYAPRGGNRVTQAIDVLLNWRQISPPTIAVGGATLLLALVLPRTRLGAFGTLAALIIPAAVVGIAQSDRIALVGDGGAIPRGLPVPTFPSFSALSFDLVTSALAIAAVILVQGAGVSQSVPNPDGRPADASRDFTAQGIANLSVGLFRGLPVGGSLGQTALNVSAGAQTRWAAIMSGVWMGVLLLLFTGPVARVAMPSLAALLILAGWRTIKLGELRSIWQTGWVSRFTIATTFIAALFLPIQVAVGIGAALDALLYVFRQSTDIVLIELVRLPDGRIDERRPPDQLPSRAVTALAVYGSLFYAGARIFAQALPSPQGAIEPVVILRLRGRTHFGATMIDILRNYAEQVQAAGGRLYLTGVDQGVRDQLERTGKIDVDGPVRVYPATSVIGESSRAAYDDAEAWLVQRATGDPTNGGTGKGQAGRDSAL